MDLKSRQKKYKHFTLIEILVVCALIGFLMAISVAAFSLATKRSAAAATQSIIKQIEIAMDAYKAKYGYYIPSDGGKGGDLTIMSNGDDGLKQFIPTYTKWTKNGTIDSAGKVMDAYGIAFWYRCPGYHNRGSFDIESAGPDGQFGYSDVESHKTVSDSDQTADNINNWSH